jgi:hypothetical protein
MVFAVASADELPKAWQARNLEPIGYVKLQGPRAFKLSVARRGERWYLFVGQGQGRENSGPPGFEVIDVSDPAAPRVVKSVSLPAATGQISSHGNLLVVGEQMPSQSGPGSSIEYPFKNTPANGPALSGMTDRAIRWAVRVAAARVRTHRNVYPGGAYAFMSAWIEVFTAEHPGDPRCERSEKTARSQSMVVARSADGELPESKSGYHGPANLSSDGRMLTLGYTPAVVNLDISDIARPSVIGSLVFSPLANVGTQAIHTVTPLPNHFLHVSTEPSAPGCKDESAAFAAIVDNSDPKNPRLVSYYPRPRPPDGSSYASFCDKGGRFGPHNVNAEIHSPDAQAPGELIFMTYFTAGLRVFDISDPNVPFETGWFLPDIGPWSEGFRGPEDVLVDTRGVIYTSMGRGKGVWLLKYAGPRAASLKFLEHAMTTRRQAMKTALAGAVGLTTGIASARTADSSGWATGIEGQRKADLGNGQFLNPILAGDFPDPSILKDGDDYYMTHSSFDASPGLLIWHSRDLVNWRPLGPALEKPLGTVFAVDLVKHAGRYYIYIPFMRARWSRGLKSFANIYVIHATSMQGPWSGPIELGIEGLIDPGHVVGEDDQRYLFLSGIKRVRLAPDGLSTAGPVEQVYEGWRYPDEWITEAYALEGPKLLRRDKWFYIISAVGGTGGPPTGHMVIVARSRSINGPWRTVPTIRSCARVECRRHGGLAAMRPRWRA